MKTILIAGGRMVFLAGTLVALGFGTRVAFASSSLDTQARVPCKRCASQAECTTCCTENGHPDGECTTSGFCFCFP